MWVCVLPIYEESKQEKPHPMKNILHCVGINENFGLFFIFCNSSQRALYSHIVSCSVMSRDNLGYFNLNISLAFNIKSSNFLWKLIKRNYKKAILSSGYMFIAMNDFSIFNISIAILTGQTLRISWRLFFPNCLVLFCYYVTDLMLLLSYVAIFCKWWCHPSLKDTSSQTGNQFYTQHFNC